YHYKCGVVDAGKEKKRSPEGLRSVVSIKFLEDELDHQLHRTSVAGEGQLRLVERSSTGIQESCTNGRITDGSHVIDAAGDELRVVEYVKDLSLELEFGVLSEANIFPDREIEVINRTGRQSVALSG